MSLVMQSIKKTGLFLSGVVLIIAGFKSNQAQAQTINNMTEAGKKKASASASAQAKSATTVEQAKPEKASASKYKKPKAARAGESAGK